MLLIICLQLESQENYEKLRSIKLTVVAMEVYHVMVNSKELFANTEYLDLNPAVA